MKSMRQIVIGLFSLAMVAQLTMGQNQAAVDANEAEIADLLARFNDVLNSAAASFVRQAVDFLNGVQSFLRLDIDNPFASMRNVVPPPLAGNINLDDCAREDDPRKCCKIPLPIKVINVTTSRTLTCQKTRTEIDINSSGASRCGLLNIFRRNFLRDCFEVQTRTVFFQDICTVQEVIGVRETQCCPTDRLTCCVGLIYLSPRTVTLRSGSDIVIKEQCATVEEFRVIVTMLENLSGSNGRA